MAIIQVEIPEALWMRLQGTGRFVEEVVVEALEKSLDELSVPKHQQPSREEIIQRLEKAGYLSDPEAWSTFLQKRLIASADEDDVEVVRETTETYSYGNLASTIVIRNRMRLDEDLSSDQVRQRLLERGLVRDPKEWDTPATRRWEQLTKAEQTQFVAEMNSMFLTDSPASTIITENRR